MFAYQDIRLLKKTNTVETAWEHNKLEVIQAVLLIGILALKSFTYPTALLHNHSYYSLHTRIKHSIPYPNP